MATCTSRRWRLPLGKLRVLSGEEVCAIVARHGFAEVRGLNLSARHRAERGRLISMIEATCLIDHKRRYNENLSTPQRQGCLVLGRPPRRFRRLGLITS